MSTGPEHPLSTAPLLSLRAWGELREATTDPAACETSDAALVAASMLSDVRDVRDALGDDLLETSAGSANRRLANELNSIERLALAAQRLGVESLTSRLRYDLATMATSCADMFWHLSEAADHLNGLAELSDEVAREVASGRPQPMSVVDVDVDVGVDVDVEEQPIDLRDRSPQIDPATPGTDDALGKIVAAAMGVDVPPAMEPHPEVPAGTTAETPTMDHATSLVESPPWAAWPNPHRESDWQPPVWSPAITTSGRWQRIGSLRARRREFRRERALIAGDEKSRGRGLRPLLPTWFSQAAATIVICTMLGLVAVGAWMLVVNGVGPF